MISKDLCNIRGEKFFVSWSGGKDSAMAFYKSIGMGGKPYGLLCMLHMDGYSFGHYLPEEVIAKQAESIGIRAIFGRTTYNDYENEFRRILFKINCDNVKHGVFGDIDIEEHVNWVDRICSDCGILVFEPLWKIPKVSLIYEIIDSGFKAIVVAVNKEFLNVDFIGRQLDKNFIKEILNTGIDVNGEKGEYHTFIYDGPIFRFPVKFDITGMKEMSSTIVAEIKLKD